MRIIDADALKEDLKDPPLHLCLGGMSMRDVLQLVDYAPTIDAVQVVRCKDCVHCEKETMTCTIFIKNRLGDDFCSEGER